MLFGIVFSSGNIIVAHCVRIIKRGEKKMWNPFRKKKAWDWAAVPIEPESSAEKDISYEIRKANADISRQKKQLDLEIMKLESEKRKIELQAEIEETKKRISDLLDDDDEEDSSSSPADVMMMALLSKVMGVGQSPQSTAIPSSLPQNPSPHISKVTLSEEQIDDIMHNLPKDIKKIAQGMSESEIDMFVSRQMPQIDEGSRIRLVARAKEGV